MSAEDREEVLVVPSPTGPLLARRRLGAELRRLRGHRTLDEVTDATLISTSKLSRLENGQGAAQQRDLRDLINFYDADKATAERLRRWASDARRQAWWKSYSDVLTEFVDVFLNYESGASLVRANTPMLLPGLLQIEADATRLLTTILQDHRPEHIDKLVQVRLRRQQILNSRDTDPTRLVAVLEEAAIRRALGLGDDVSREQLLYPREVFAIQILSLDVGLHPDVMGDLTVFRLTDDINRDAVSTEISSGNGYIEEKSSMLEQSLMFGASASNALYHNSSAPAAEIRRYAHPHPEGAAVGLPTSIAA